MNFNEISLPYNILLYEYQSNPPCISEVYKPYRLLQKLNQPGIFRNFNTGEIQETVFLPTSNPDYRNISSHLIYTNYAGISETRQVNDRNSSMRMRK